MFKQELLSLVTQGLNDLELAQAKGKVPKNSLSESHFFSVWVGQVLKQKRFDISLVPMLTAWQQQARTLGAGANLKQVFAQLKSTYSGIEQASVPLKPEVLENLIASLEGSQWQVSYVDRISKKMSIKTQGLSSLVICDNDLQQAFTAKQTLHCYVRGQHAQFVDHCYALGLLAYKVTDYKSAVKFHGEYMLHANNNKLKLPEIPTHCL